MLQFTAVFSSIWSLTGTPVLRYCVTWANGTGHCENALEAPNPLNFTIPHSVDPTTVRIEILNINSPDIILVDSLYYEGRICELIHPHLAINKVSRDTFEAETEVDVKDNTVDMDTRDNRAIEDASEELKATAETLGKPADFVACEALTCDFNHNHSCFYKLSGFGSTSPWMIGTSFVGNRHTGVQRLNEEDSNRLGFAYVGRDHVDESNEVFVMESPKFTISTDARLFFDVYLRSHSPRLKVCIDSFDDCPYESPKVSKHAFWILDNSVVLRKGVRKSQTEQLCF
ncbi:hypothetical protein OESDEN_07792 [Oesophagostomum dentatum]|uniref:MAM domain-containing protein n=1 Tax=Oesophagostomum dentatum TaxID=61180 RepID=A0A0B1T425_OESDE|nr:hypothetical protein OESDEN_07792 [Oesophagostomum dentatum]